MPSDDDRQPEDSGGLAVIKCTQVCPEYLYLYLMSDTGRTVTDILVAGAGKMRNTSIEMLKELPIIIPEYDDQTYINDYMLLSCFNRREYEFEPALTSLTCYSMLRKQRDKNQKVEDVLNIELARRIKAHNEAQLRSFLSVVLKELNVCFKNGAYKATLMLAGSILEAVLIDWLSEIHHKDYFSQTYYVKDRYTGNQKRADLIDYIDAIKYIERPRWAKEASKAHEIRKKRNLVHARLCINTDEVNKKTCEMVIGYLKDVLKTRGIR